MRGGLAARINRFECHSSTNRTHLYGFTPRTGMIAAKLAAIQGERQGSQVGAGALQARRTVLHGMDHVCDAVGHQLGPWQLQRAFRAARMAVEDLPEGFRFHDLRHYYASLLINSGLDVKVVQARLRHASAKTTLDTYGHLWPDSDETTRAAISSVMTTRNGTLAANLRPSGAIVKSFP